MLRRKVKSFFLHTKVFYKPTILARTFTNNKLDIIVKSSHPSIDYPNISIDQYVWKNVSKWSDKTAIVDGITKRSINYGQLRDQCRTLAVHLQSTFKLNFGDTIGICLANSIEFPIITLAASECGLTTTTINPIYTADEISRQLINSDAKIIFGLSSNSNILETAVKLTERSIKIVYVRQNSNESIPRHGIAFDELIKTEKVDLNNFKQFQRDNSEIALLPYSSGTTGLSKGVLLTHKNIVCNSIMHNSDTGKGKLAHEAIGNHQDIVPCVLPFFHIYGLVVCLLSKLAIGCKLVTLNKFHPDTFLNVLHDYKSSILYIVPPIVIFMNNSDKLKLKHTESIRYVMSGAAPLGYKDVEYFLQKAPNSQFIQGYGLTETSPMVTISAIGSKNYASVGNLSRDTEAKIVDVDDEEHLGLGPNMTGELWVKGPQVMSGYHKNEKATRETLINGWLRTGDIGHYDENFEFYITDRLKELIKVKGFQVAPAELEEILRSHTDIDEAAVIGIPHPNFGEVPRAYIVKKKDSNINEEQIKNFVEEKVASFKRLDSVEFLKEIPKTATGKILRRELKSLYQNNKQINL